MGDGRAEFVLLGVVRVADLNVADDPRAEHRLTGPDALQRDPVVVSGPFSCHCIFNQWETEHFLDDMYICTYNKLMDVEWDVHKAESNLDKHGVDFVDAASALYDRLAVTVPDDSVDEERYATIGIDALGRLLVVVYTWRGETPRIISARKASARECRNYEDKS